MTPNASKQGKFGSLGGHIFVHIFLPCMWGAGVSRRIAVFNQLLAMLPHMIAFLIPEE